MYADRGDNESTNNSFESEIHQNLHLRHYFEEF